MQTGNKSFDADGDGVTERPVVGDLDAETDGDGDAALERDGDGVAVRDGVGGGHVTGPAAMTRTR